MTMSSNKLEEKLNQLVEFRRTRSDDLTLYRV